MARRSGAARPSSAGGPPGVEGLEVHDVARLVETGLDAKVIGSCLEDERAVGGEGSGRGAWPPPRLHDLAPRIEARVDEELHGGAAVGHPGSVDGVDSRPRVLHLHQIDGARVRAGFGRHELEVLQTLAMERHRVGDPARPEQAIELGRLFAQLELEG